MKPRYVSYLLRVWQTGSAEAPKWVASLEDPHSHRVTHFNSLDALLQHLLQTTQKTGEEPSPAQNHEAS